MPHIESHPNLEILDHLPQGVFLLRRNGTIAFWNQCLEDWTGVARSTIVGNSLETYFPDLSTPKYTSRFEPLFEGGPPATFSSQFHPQFLPCSLPNGQPRIQQTMAKAIWNKHTEEWQALVIIQDISDLKRQAMESQRLRKQAQVEIDERKEIEAALRKSEERFKGLINSGPILMWTCLPDGQCDFLNAQWIKYTGIPEADQLGYKWFEQIHPEDLEHTQKDWQRAVESGNFFRTQFRIRHRQGHYRWFLTLANHIRDTNGQIVKWIGCNIDITAQLATENDMAQLQGAVDQGVEGLALLDQAGKFTYVNRAYASMFGYDIKELIAQSWKILYSRDQLENLEGTCFSKLRNAGSWQGELLGLRKDGTMIPVEFSLALLMEDPNSSTGLISTCRDISDRKRAEERFRLVVETAPNGIVMTDASGSIVLVNQFIESLFGHSRAELLGQPIEVLIPDRFKEEHPRQRSAYLTSMSLDHVMGKGREVWGFHKNGHDIPIEVGLNPIYTQEGLFILASIVDITERKTAEEKIQRNARDLEQKNQELMITRDQAVAATKSKSDFLSTMSHEIRTPLNGVIGMTDLILDTALDADQQEMVRTVQNSGEFLLTIINDILDFSKIEAGKLDLEVIDFDIRTALDEVLDVLASKACLKNVELIGLVYANIPQHLRGDPGRIRQMLFNLIGNAIKFTAQGEVVVTIQLSEDQSAIPTLKLSVTDSGIGISPEAQQSLFKSFQQADSSTTRKFGGTGLGLAICKKLVTLMHGEIGVTSHEGQGSTFWFTLPLIHGSSTPDTVIPKTSLQNHRLCIIESNDTIRFLLNHYAQSWGMQCEVAQNGHDGLALLQKRAREGNPFDVALLDHTLSEAIHEDGISLAKRIRQDTDIAHTPLVLLTALGKRGEGKMAHDAGFNGYLAKPIRHQQLHQCLQMIVESQQASGAFIESSSLPPLITRHTVEEAQARGQCQILLAEDNVVNQKVAVRMIQKLGYRVDVVVNGKEALEAVDRTGYDLVLMDCQMPEMDGLEATKKIREAENLNRESNVDISPDALPLPSNNNSRLPIIALTANALTGDREMCLQAGMDDFLSKPVRIEELSNMIIKWLPDRPTNESSAPSVTAPPRKDSRTMQPCLDETILQNLKDLGGEDDPEFFLTVLDQFLEDLPRHLEGIQQAINQQDSDALTKTAHTCKGSSRSIGATSLADVSYALETMGREGTFEGTTLKFEEWLKEKERTTLALQQEREQLAPSPP